jgi:hypothetical protein
LVVVSWGGPVAKVDAFKRIIPNNILSQTSRVPGVVRVKMTPILSKTPLPATTPLPPIPLSSSDPTSIPITYPTTIDVEAEALPEKPEAVAFWWKQKRKHLKICRFNFYSVSKFLYKF